MQRSHLVAKEYPEASGEVIDFTVDHQGIEKMGLKVFFASAVKSAESAYQTLKTSRVVAVGSLSDSIVEASDKVNLAIESCVTGSLEYRKDTGSKENLAKLMNLKV